MNTNYIKCGNCYDLIKSGTTAIACIKHDRKYIGFELNEEYYNTCCKRIEKETNKNECNTKNTK